jgi:hypothetical protein
VRATRPHIYSADAPDPSTDVDRLQELADRINRTHPEIPSIQTALAHEAALDTALETMTAQPPVDRAQKESVPDLASAGPGAGREDLG